MSNPFEIDAEGSNYNEIVKTYEIDDENGNTKLFTTLNDAREYAKKHNLDKSDISVRDLQTTDDIARQAIKDGYDGVIVRNVQDGSSAIADDYIVFNPNQIKSAEPVTYDEEGNVIPLSERFSESDDIRYSVSDKKFYFHTNEKDFDATMKKAIEEGALLNRINLDSQVDLIQIQPHNFKGDKIIESAKQWAYKHISTTEDDIKNNRLPKLIDGTPYTISHTSIDKFLSKPTIDKSENLGVHLAVLQDLNNIIGNSLELFIHPDYNEKNENGDRIIDKRKINKNVLIHRLFGVIGIDNKTYKVKTTIKEYRQKTTQNKAYTYEITKIELLDNPNNSIMVWDNTNSTSEGLTISAAKLLTYSDIAKYFGENFLQNPNIVDNQGDIEEDIRYSTTDSQENSDTLQSAIETDDVEMPEYRDADHLGETMMQYFERYNKWRERVMADNMNPDGTPKLNIPVAPICFGYPISQQNQ